jgi:hypothetical protein
LNLEENKLVNESAIRAKIHGIDKTLGELQEQLDRGYIDVGRYTRLKADWERQKAELEAQLTGAVGDQVGRVTPEQQARRQKLYAILRDHFDKEELRTLCSIELGIEYDDLRGDGRLGKIEGLLAYCERHGRTDELVKICRRLRPNAPW